MGIQIKIDMETEISEIKKICFLIQLINLNRYENTFFRKS